LVSEIVQLPECEPVKCGLPPVIQNALYTEVGLGAPLPQGQEVDYEMVLEYTCVSGYTLDGLASGVTGFSVTCSAAKQFEGHTATCDIVKYLVDGYVVDAASRQVTPLSARVSAGGEFADTDQSGYWSLRLPEGTYTLEAYYTGEVDPLNGKMGYIEMKERPLNVVDSDVTEKIALSSKLSDEDWRVIVRWEDSQDLDSSLKFGLGESCDVSYEQPMKTCLGTGNDVRGPINAELEKDSAAKGPETLAIRKVSGACNPMRGACGIYFYVKDHSGSGLADSGVVVRLYNGAEEKARYVYPKDSDLDGKVWPVFTIDAATKELHPGKNLLCPYIGAEGQADWGLSMQSTGFSVLPANSLATGFYLSGTEFLYQLQTANYATLENTEGMDCYDASWASTFNSAGWSECMEGYFIAGLYRTGDGPLDNGFVPEGSNNYQGLGGQRGIHQIDMAKCCKPKETKKTHVDCYDQTWSVQEAGYYSCPTDKMLVALKRGAGNELQNLVAGRCCKFQTTDCYRG